ncbi:RHS repeat-associated core domain-containing protein [Kribbella sp. NPDC051587]|uniref:RHS repeat-associated core domain-containing protein n=1 Tax=Kribbella sp. NPDC051587 TaxID=3364119 RepID=UPI0037B59585
MPRHPVPRVLTIAMVGVLTTGLLSGAAQFPAVAAPAAAPAQPKPVAKRQSVPVKVVVPTKGVPDRDVPVTAPGANAWPQAASAVVDLGTAAKAAATGLPIKIGPSATATRGAKAATPGKVKVDLLGRSGSQLRVQLSRADGVATSGAASLTVDYSAFSHAYGGDWANRLQLVRLPDCALKTPDRADCAAVPLPTKNAGQGEASADVTVADRPTTYALVAAAAGTAGDSGATSLTPTATWQVGGSSGDFTWNYPMEVPPSLGGPKADIGLSYSSGSVDGRTTSANSQSSWAGAGFELAPGGSIERRYAPCSIKSQQNGNNGTKTVGDLCWGTDNATFTLNGGGGELVKDDNETGDIWHPRNDDGTRIERKYGALNGDGGQAGTGPGAAGEYWVITDKAGTKFYFGLNRLPGFQTNDRETQSTWTVPVAGNNGAEPCNKTAFADSFCDQAYRWNLDYVVDTHGNTMSLFYTKEDNQYARNLTATSVSTYTRSGYISRIEYGQADGKVYRDPAVAAVDFTTADRCRTGIVCSAPSEFPDTPLDLECASHTDCTNHYTPTFWTKKRLSRVTTSVWRGTAYSGVKQWDYRYSFLDPNDNSRSPILWLEGITNTGLVGGTATTPETTFAAEWRDNRVVSQGDGYPRFAWPRVGAVTSGTGGQLVVAYSTAQCSAGNLPTDPSNNTKLCHPIKWTPKDQAERQDWFNKYLVTGVTENDTTGRGVPVETTVEYEGTPAWRHDDEDGLVEVDNKTWSQWRGYGKVKVTKGASSAAPEVTENVYFRGMDGDLKADGSTKTATVKGSDGVAIPDSNTLSGAVREQTTLDGTAVVDSAITDHWVSAATASRKNSWGTVTKSYKIEQEATQQSQTLPGGGTRKSASKNHFTADGVLEWTSDSHDVAKTTDDTCTRYWYTGNAALGIAELPTRKQTVSVACDKTFTNNQVLGDELTAYDNGTTVTKGDAASIRRLSGFDTAGAPVYQTVSTSTFDEVGRVKTSTNADDKQTRADYLPVGRAPLTQTTVTEPNGQTSKTLLDPAWGTESTVIDPAGRATDTKRDPLGRVVKTFLPGQDRGTANSESTYSVNTTKPNTVTTSTLNDDGSRTVEMQLSDGLLRTRQTQAAAPGGGRVITDHVFDARGLEVAQLGPYYNSAPPSPDFVVPTDESALPEKKTIEYDDQGRPTVERFFSLGKELWHTTHTVTANSETVVPPNGEQATTKITDVEGRVTELLKYPGDPATTTPDKTTYTYHPAGQLATVTDPAGNVWKYDYDLRGRKIKDTDPDKGVTTYTYNDLDQVTSTTEEATKSTLSYKYDEMGRKTAMYQGSLSTGVLLAEWKYDDVKPGSLSSATRWVNGQPYTIKYTSYDNASLPTGSDVVIPATEGALGKTYSVATTYTPDGQVKTTKLPGVGGLPEETLETTYNEVNLPQSLGVQGHEDQTYVLGTSYTPFKETEELALGRNGQWVQQQFGYELGTHRLHSAQVNTALTDNVEKTEYSYDQAGNITRISDTGADQQADYQCFKYDSYRRLTSAWTPGDGKCETAPTAGALGGPAPYWHSWTFDVTGNRRSETRTTTAGVTTSKYTYLTDKPHALDNVVTTSGATTRTDKYTYNERGDLKTRNLNGVTDTMTFDSEGRLNEVAGNGKKTSYLYDADGNRLIKRDPTGTTLYLGGTELFLKTGTAQPVGTRYYTFGGATVAVRVGNDIDWIASDLHGTATASIDAATLAVQRRRTTPYGETRGAAPTAWPGTRGFVNGTIDDSTGLVHLGAREYDPTRGRFISVDPVVDPSDPQQLNGYSYANNNPVVFSDADGKRYVTDVIQETRVRLRTLTERVVTYQTYLIKYTAMSRDLSNKAKMADALGMHAMAAAYRGMGTAYKRVTKKIVIVRNRTIREVVRVTRVIRRYVGPDEQNSLDQIARSAIQLTDPSKGSQATWAQITALLAFQNATTSWAKKTMVLTSTGGGGSPPAGINIEPDSPSEDLPVKIYVMAAFGVEYALIGAGTGAVIGSVFPGPGTVVGAIAGTLIGTGGGIIVGGLAYNDSMGPGGMNWSKLWRWFVSAPGYVGGTNYRDMPKQQVLPPPVIGGPGAPGPWQGQSVQPPPVIGGR